MITTCQQSEIKRIVVLLVTCKSRSSSGAGSGSGVRGQLTSSAADEIEVVLSILEVLPAPLHVVRDVHESHVVVAVPELVHGVVEVALLERLLFPG